MKQAELPFVRAMFDKIAPRYDFLNRLLSLRRDIYWRRTLAAALAPGPAALVLDAACGTCDVGLEILRQSKHPLRIIAVDFSREMLRLARTKLESGVALQPAISLAAVDVLDLPFAGARFEGVTMAFGIRNIQNKLAALAGFFEVLKPGGRLAILELATPESGMLRRLYLFYFNRLLPFVGRFFSRHAYAYRYLPASVAGFPPAARFAALLRQAGFERVRYRKLTLGIAVVFIADKPATARSNGKPGAPADEKDL